MKFITEIELRNEFRKCPFTTYQIDDSERLTSEARQFLKDRDVTINKESEFSTTLVESVENKTFLLNSQLLYTSFLEGIVLCKNQQKTISEELYSMSVVIRQLMNEETEPEIEFNFIPQSKEQVKEEITLSHLFSLEGKIIVKLVQLSTEVNLLKNNFEININSKQVQQLDMISTRIQFLTSQLMGE